MKQWYEKEGRDEDVVLSTKACLVRNIKGYNFPSKMDDKDAESLLSKVDSVIDRNQFSGGRATDIINTGDTAELMKAQISGRDGSLLFSPDKKSIYYTEDYGLSIAVGNSEHLTIKAQAPGHDIGVYRLAEKAAVELEKKLDTWEHQHNLAASIFELDRAGFDILPCTSNWAHVGGAEAMLGFCKKNVNPAHLKGYLMAPWARTVKEEKPKLVEGIKLFAAARRKYYPIEAL